MTRRCIHNLLSLDRRSAMDRWLDRGGARCSMIMFVRGLAYDAIECHECHWSRGGDQYCAAALVIIMSGPGWPGTAIGTLTPGEIRPGRVVEKSVRGRFFFFVFFFVSFFFLGIICLIIIKVINRR